MIPILLTTSVMLIALSVARLLADEETALARMPGWAPLLLLGLAALLAGLAVVNMLLVRQQMRSPAADRSPR